MGRLLRLEAALVAYRARLEAASRWDWLAPMLPRLLGGPPSPALWRALYTDASVSEAELLPPETMLVVLLMAHTLERDGLARDGSNPPTFAELWDDMIRLHDWEQSAPPDAFLPMSEQEYEEAKATLPALVAWWDACPVPSAIIFWKGLHFAPDLSWVDALLARLETGAGWTMAEVKDAGGAVVERYPWPRWDTTPAPDRLEAARLAETALEELDAMAADKRPQTLEEVKQWLQRMRKS